MTWYVTRKPDGSLASAHRDHMVGYNDETLEDEAAEIVAFLAPPAPTLAQLLGPTDHEMARAGEDLFATLIAKGVIAKSDIPDVVVARINARRAIRGQSAL
jgi:hypothetical protein